MSEKISLDSSDCDTYFREWVVSQAILCYAIKEI